MKDIKTLLTYLFKKKKKIFNIFPGSLCKSKCVCQCTSGGPDRNLTLDCQDKGFINVQVALTVSSKSGRCTVTDCTCEDAVCIYDNSTVERTEYWSDLCNGNATCQGMVEEGVNSDGSFKYCTTDPTFVLWKCSILLPKNNIAIYFNFTIYNLHLQLKFTCL